jgi:hypothetical protein
MLVVRYLQGANGTRLVVKQRVNVRGICWVVRLLEFSLLQQIAVVPRMFLRIGACGDPRIFFEA